MSKIITEKLIEEKLKEKGISMYDGDDNALAKLQDYYEFELTDSYNRTPDYSIFAESTADGYDQTILYLQNLQLMVMKYGLLQAVTVETYV
jgi:hypothetical protein